MLSAVTADFAAVPNVHVVTLLDERCPELQLDPRVEVRRVAPSEEPSTFRAQASQSDYALVIAPEIDGVLHQRCVWAREAGAKLLGPSPDAVALTSDKLALARHWQSAGVPTPMTVPRTDESPPFPPPWIAKPRWGAGSQGILFPLSGKSGRGEKEGLLPSTGFGGMRSHLSSACKAEKQNTLPSPGFAGEGSGVRVEGDSILQPLIPGRPASVAFLIGPKQTIAMPPCWQHLDESMHYLGGTVPIPPELAFRARAIATAAVSGIPNLFGYIGVDVLLGDPDMAIEINPRLTTSYIGLRQLATKNLAEAMLRIVQGKRAELSWGNSAVSWSCAELS